MGSQTRATHSAVAPRATYSAVAGGKCSAVAAGKCSAVAGGDYTFEAGTRERSTVNRSN